MTTAIDVYEQDVELEFSMKRLAINEVRRVLLTLPDDIPMPEISNSTGATGIWLNWSVTYESLHFGRSVCTVMFRVGQPVRVEAPRWKETGVGYVTSSYSDTLGNVMNDVVYPLVRAGKCRASILDSQERQDHYTPN